MIQKGIIDRVIDKYTYKVRIPKYDKVQSAAFSTKTEDLASGIVCTIPGIDISYVENDIVLVSFENDELSKPIILGLLYREQSSDSDITVSNVDSSLENIKQSINKLNSSELYTHVKYSNDNGLTFTSLFSSNYYESSEGEDVFCTPYFDEDQEIKGIQIDKTCRIINWSIIDDNNKDITSNIGIETIVFDSNGNTIKKVNKEEHLSSITINNSSQIDGDLYINYKLYISKEYLDTLHVSLATDKDTLGTVQGEYVGIYISNNSAPSLNPKDYHWISFNASLENYISELKIKIDIDINSKLLELKNEIDSEIDTTTKTIFYGNATWTQAEVDVYCQHGYTGVWPRDTVHGYTGEIEAGNILYITVTNTGTSPSDPSDDSYGRLTLRATVDATSSEPATATVLTYDISGEVGIDALARFKSSLLAPGDETLIYGGHITTGYIQDATGKNFIQLSNEARAQAGFMEFKNDKTWESSTSGIQWKTYLHYILTEDTTPDPDKTYYQLIDGEYEVITPAPENPKAVDAYENTDTGALSVKGTVYADAGVIGGAEILNNVLKITTGNLSIGKYITFDYIPTLTSSQPNDWIDNWTNYYEKNPSYGPQADEYIHVGGTTAPTWVADTYYEKKEDNPRLIIGNKAKMAITIDVNEKVNNGQMTFWQNWQPVAYINNNRMTIPESVMLREMMVGQDKWSWREHDGNLQLKWIGA